MPSRLRSSDVRKVDGTSYLVEHCDRLEYSGEWVDDGYFVRNPETKSLLRHFYGYPTDSDLRKVYYDLQEDNDRWYENDPEY